MKTPAAYLALIGLALLTASLVDRSGGRRGLEDDKAAIMDVIERQAAAFWAKDFARWSDTWVRADYARRIGWSPTGGRLVRRW